LDPIGGPGGETVIAPIDPRTRELLAEAAGWRLLSLLFDCPGKAWREQVGKLAEEVNDPELRSCARLALEQATEEFHHSTFGPGGPAAPREVSYCDMLQLGYLISELEAYYGAFAYHPVTGEAPDHISVESGFLSFLQMKQAFAHASGNLKHAAVTAEAAGRFVGEHLSRIARPLAEQLVHSGLQYLAEAARALCKRVGAVPHRVPSAAGDLSVVHEESVFSKNGDSLPVSALDAC
jgi:nitrate reductase assembly molybdenum cofactor insertion protein NarJ